MGAGWIDPEIGLKCWSRDFQFIGEATPLLLAEWWSSFTYRLAETYLYKFKFEVVWNKSRGSINRGWRVRTHLHNCSISLARTLFSKFRTRHTAAFVWDIAYSYCYCCFIVCCYRNVSMFCRIIFLFFLRYVYLPIYLTPAARFRLLLMNEMFVSTLWEYALSLPLFLPLLVSQCTYIHTHTYIWFGQLSN